MMQSLLCCLDVWLALVFFLLNMDLFKDFEFINDYVCGYVLVFAVIFMCKYLGWVLSYVISTNM